MKKNSFSTIIPAATLKPVAALKPTAALKPIDILKPIVALKPAAALTLAQRIMAPTPKFFRALRTIGILIGLVGASLLASPVALPAAIVTLGGYLALAGGIMTGVAQTAVGKE